MLEPGLKEPVDITILPPRPRGPRRSRVLAAGALVLAAGLGILGATLVLRGPRVTVIALDPVPIATMAEGAPLAVRGTVTEIYGNAFVLQDASGRALVDTGPEGEDDTLVARNEAVTVQGRFERGVLRAEALTHPDGRTDVLGPPGPPHGGPLAWVGRRLHLPPG